MNSPIALLPSKVAVQEVLKLAKSLGISVTGIGSQTTPDGARVVTAAPSTEKNNFPLKFDKQTRSMSVPALYVDLATWQYLPPQIVQGGPSEGEDSWLRVAVPTSYDPLDFWATVFIGSAGYQWVKDSDANPYPPGTSAFVANGDNSVHYRYIARVTNHEVTPYFITEGIIKGFLS